MKNRIVLISFLLIGLTTLLSATFASSEAFDDPPHTIFLPVILKDSGLLYVDDFSQSDSGWPIRDDLIVRWGYQEEEYEMLIRDPDMWAGSLAPFDGYSDYGVEADMRRLQGDKSEYGLIFDFMDWDNYYAFVVDPGKQSFAVLKVLNGAFGFVYPRTSEATINADDETNRLRVDKNGDEITVRVNDKLIATTSDSGFNVDSRVGLFVWGDDDVPASVRYDNFEIWRVGAGMAQSSRIRLAEPAVGSGANYGPDLNRIFDD